MKKCLVGVNVLARGEAEVLEREAALWEEVRERGSVS
jgi:hypothetical protein